MASDVKAVLKVEGEQSFNQAFKNATSSVKALDSAVKLNGAAFENSADKMSSLQERSSLLRQEIQAQENVIKTANEELKRLRDEYGEGSTQVNDYQAKVNKASTQLEKMKTELDKNEHALKNFGEEAKVAGQKISETGEKIAKLGSSMKWLSAGAAAGLTSMFNAASDLNENLNKTEVVFDEMSDDVIAWSKTTLDSFGIAQSSALDMAAYFGDMATSMGLTRDQAAELGMELVGRAGDLASFKNVSLDVAQTGLGAIFTGQAASLRRFGIVMTEANLEAFALAQGFEKQYKDMSQAEQVLLRYQFVMDATKNSAGDFANTSDGAANSVRVAKESLKEAAATLGEEVIPLVLPLIQNLTELVQGVNALDEGTKNMIVTGLAITAVASPILTICGTIIKGIGWIAGTGLPAITGALGTAGTAATAAGTAGAAGISAMLGPIALVAGAVVGLIALFDQLENKKNRALNQQRMDNINTNYKRISHDEMQYYNAKDLTSVWNGSGWDDYVKNGASMTTQGRRDYYADQMEKDSVTNNNYNFDVNVSQISDLQDLLNMADSAQRLDRMGWSN
jgi:hypothetical protein